jgi:hypothetical protein
MRDQSLLINGHWVPGVGTFEVHDPFDQSLVGTVGVESNTRRQPRNNPACRAVALTSSSDRRGRSEARSRFRIPTSTAG